MRNWYTSQELAGLPGLPGSVPGIRKLAARLDWECRKRAASKAVGVSGESSPSNDMQEQNTRLKKLLAEFVTAGVAGPSVSLLQRAQLELA